MARPTNSKRLPPLPAKAPGRPPRPGYREQYGVIVICPDEAAQRAVFDGLRLLAPCAIKVVVT